MQPQKRYDQFRAKDGSVYDRDGNLVRWGKQRKPEPKVAPLDEERNDDGLCHYCERSCCKHTSCGNCARCVS